MSLRPLVASRKGRKVVQYQIVHQVGAPWEGQDWVTHDVPLFDSKEAAENYLASGVLKIQDPNCPSRQYTYYVREADQYPPCYSEPPVAPDAVCEHEYCPRHTTIWLKSEGVSHEASVGLTAVLDFTENYGGGNIVAEALGGFDSFDQLTDFHTVWEGPKLTEWYTANLPLVVYCLEQTSWKGKEYWLQARYHQIRVRDDSV